MAAQNQVNITIRPTSTSPFLKQVERITKLHEAKAHDYNSEGEDIWANYRFAGDLSDVDTFQAMFTRLCEKVYRVRSLRRRGKSMVQDESLIETLEDIAVISLLLAAYLEEHGDQDRLTTTMTIMTPVFNDVSDETVSSR